MTNAEIRAEREFMESMGYLTVQDLLRDCLVELKQDYLSQLAECGIYAEVMDVDYDEPSMADLAQADLLISDEVIFEHYDGVIFTPDDFFCLMETED